jgi:hypothetical protein
MRNSPTLEVQSAVLLFFPALAVIANLLVILAVRGTSPTPIVWAFLPTAASLYVLGIASWRSLRRQPALGLSLCVWLMLLTLPGQLVSSEQGVRIVLLVLTLVLPGVFALAFAARSLWPR